LTNVCPEATTGASSEGYSCPTKLPNRGKDADSCKDEDVDNVETAVSRFPSPNRKRRVSLAKSLESAVAAQEAAEENEVRKDEKELPTPRTDVPTAEPQRLPVPVCTFERTAWQFQQMQSMLQFSPTSPIQLRPSTVMRCSPAQPSPGLAQTQPIPAQLVLESPSKTMSIAPMAFESPSQAMSIAPEVMNIPGSPQTDLEFKQILACHKKSPKSAISSTELKQLIEKGPPGLDPPRASEAESARSLGCTPPLCWATIAAGVLAKPSEDGQSKNEMMDVVLMECFLQAITTRVLARNLPIKGTTLYTQHMRPCRRIGTSLNVKESTFHYFGAFLQHLESLGLLTLKPNETDAVIIDICRNHPEIQAWHPWPASATVEEFERTESLQRDV